MNNYEPANLETIQANTPIFAYALGTQDERQRIIGLLQNHKLLPTYNKIVSEFSEELWQNIQQRLIKEIKGEQNV